MTAWQKGGVAGAGVVTKGDISENGDEEGNVTRKSSAKMAAYHDSKKRSVSVAAENTKNRMTYGAATRKGMKNNGGVSAVATVSNIAAAWRQQSRRGRRR